MFFNLLATNPSSFLFSLTALIFIGLAAVVFLFFSIIPVLRGAPFVPIHKQRLDLALKFLNLKPCQKAVDLGSGDGRVLIEIAKRGVMAVGYEINPFLVLKTKMEIKKQGLSSLVSCHWKSFWGVNFNQFDAIFIFGMSHIMKGIEKKAQKELKQGASLVCFVFPLPNWPASNASGVANAGWRPIFSENGVYIYQKQ